MKRLEGIKQKPENNDNDSPEYISEVPSVRQQLESLASDETFSVEHAKLKQELASDPEYLTFAAAEAEIKELTAQSYTEESITVAQQLYKQLSELKSNLYSNVRYKDYAQSIERMYDFEYSAARAIDADSPEAKMLLASLGAEADMTDIDAAPFMNYKDNTAEAWQYVPDAAIKDYLSARPFMDTSHMRLDGNKIRIRSETKNDSFAIPASLFVSAASFESWTGRREGIGKAWSSLYGYGDTTSLNVMKHYASLETELPPVEFVNVYVQPDGRMFADNDAGDSHRIGAAFLRGDTSVKAENVNFVMLDRNILTD